MLEQLAHVFGVGVLFILIFVHVHVVPFVGGDFLVGDGGYYGVDAEGGFGGVLDCGFGREDAAGDGGDLARLLDVVARRGYLAVLLEAEADEEFDQRLARGQFGYVGPVFARVYLDADVGGFDSGVFVLDAEVESAVLYYREDVERELAVFEQVEVALHVGYPRALGSVALLVVSGGGLGGFVRALALDFGAAVFEERGRSVEFEEEAAEFQTRHLMGRDDLEPREVFVLAVVAVDHVRHEHGGAFGRGRFGGYPADVAVDQLRGRCELDFFSRQAAAVHFHDGLDALELHAGGKRFEHRLRVGGLYLEIRQPAVRVLAKQVDALFVPSFELRHRELVHDLGGRLDELRHGGGRFGDEALGEG